MKKILLLPILAAVLPGMATAAQEVPESCQPKVSGALSLADEADDARLQCDIDRAAILADRSEKLFNASLDPMIRIVDTAASPSGAVYVYDVTEELGVLTLDARSVPADMNDTSRVPVCRLRTILSDEAAASVPAALDQASSPDLPGYAERLEVVVNPDGSRSYALLLEGSHDIVTTIHTADGEERHFSRNAGQSDLVSNLNATIIGVANVSNGWTCNSN